MRWKVINLNCILKPIRDFGCCWSQLLLRHHLLHLMTLLLLTERVIVFHHGADHFIVNKLIGTFNCNNLELMEIRSNGRSNAITRAATWWSSPTAPKVWCAALRPVSITRTATCSLSATHIRPFAHWRMYVKVCPFRYMLRRTVKVAEPSNPINCWHFTWGRIASKTTGKKPVHLKDPKGATYTRNGKETSWRCSSKSKCPAVVRKLKEDIDYQLHNNHSCKGTNGKTRNHGPTGVPAIPAGIQEHLGDTQEALTSVVILSYANETQ